MPVAFVFHILMSPPPVFAASSFAAPSATPRPFTPDVSRWRGRDAEIGRTSVVIQLLKAAATASPAPPAVTRERGHRLFLHLVYRRHSSETDAAPAALRRAYLTELTAAERTRLAARADGIMAALCTDDPEEFARFQTARRRPKWTETKTTAHLAVADAAERHGALTLAASIRRNVDQAQRTLALIQFDELLRTGAGCAADTLLF